MPNNGITLRDRQHLQKTIKHSEVSARAGRFTFGNRRRGAGHLHSDYDITKVQHYLKRRNKMPNSNIKAYLERQKAEREEKLAGYNDLLE